MFGSTLPVGRARAADVEALLLSCMDFRLLDDIVRYMESRGLKDNYDHVILAGASLGALTETYPAWGRTFFEHVRVAIDLHGIKRIIVMNHRDYGAYRVLLGPESMSSPEIESASHQTQLHALRDALGAKHPELKTELLLMALDGSVETIG